MSTFEVTEDHDLSDPELYNLSTYPTTLIDAMQHRDNLSLIGWRASYLIWKFFWKGEHFPAFLMESGNNHVEECKARTYVYVTVGQPASLPLNVRLLKLWGGTTSEGWSFRLGATIAWIVFMCMTKFQDPTAIDTPLICVLPDGTVTLAKRC